MKTVLIAFVTALGFTAFAAHAQELGFAVVDADASGTVTLEEATLAGWEWTEEQFATADGDGDGVLSEVEFLAATGQ